MFCILFNMCFVISKPAIVYKSVQLATQQAAIQMFLARANIAQRHVAPVETTFVRLCWGHTASMVAIFKWTPSDRAIDINSSLRLPLLQSVSHF